MTTLTTVFGRSKGQNFFLTFAAFKASLLSRGHTSVWIANRGDMRSTDDYPMCSHRVVLRKQIGRAHFLETREKCSGMRGGAQNLSVGLKKSLVFSHPEYDLPGTHSCEGARPATSASSVGKRFSAPEMNGENGAYSCTPFAWSKKQLLSRACSRHEKIKGMSTRFATVTIDERFPIALPSAPSVASYIDSGLCFGKFGQNKASMHIQKIIAVEALVSIYPSAVSFFGAFSGRLSELQSCLLDEFWRAGTARNGSSGSLPPTEGAFLVRDPAVEGDGCMKDTDHPFSHPRSHLGDRASVPMRRACAWCNDQFGRGQNTMLGWSDPIFWPVPVAKVIRRVAPALWRVARRILPAFRASIPSIAVHALAQFHNKVI